MKSLKNFLVLEVCVIAVFCYALTPIFGQGNPPTYGQFCNGTMPCNKNSTLGLACSNLTCSCVHGRWWDSEKCVAFANEECLTLPSNGSQPVFCTPNAQCLSDGVFPVSTDKCFCSIGFSRTPKGDCRATHGGPCASSPFCNPYEFLDCQSNNTCACPSDNIWDHQDKICKALIGGDCSMGIVARKCVGLSTCGTNFKCSCPTGSNATLDRMNCVKERGQQCTADNECLDSLSCIVTQTTTVPPTTQASSATTQKAGQLSESEGTEDGHLMASTGTCDCKATEVYNSNTKKCEILVGEPCDVSNSMKLCVPNSECVKNTCTCKANFTPESGACVAGYGTDCSAGTEAVCNAKAYLECNNTTKKCECAGGYTINSESKICVGSNGKDCSDDKNCDDTTSTCNPQKKCECKSNFVVSPDNSKCFSGYNSSCTIVACSTSNFLSCRNGICSCETADSHLYNSNSRKCEALAGASCAANANGEIISCITNSTCDSTSKTCACNEKFHLTDTKMCSDNAGQGIYIATFTVFLSTIFSQLM